MDNTMYINSLTAILENCQKPLRDFLGDSEEAIFYGWTLADFSLCKGPAIKKKINGRIVKYNLPERKIYIEDIGSCVLNDAAGIVNDIKWQK